MAPSPEQVTMLGRGCAKVVPAAFADDEDPAEAFDRALAVAVGKVRASRVATALYLLLFLGHGVVLWMHWSTTAAEGFFFARLAVVQACLALEAGVYAAGDLSWWAPCCRRSKGGLSWLEFASRVRLLTAAVAWAWLVPWAAELRCRCALKPPEKAALMLAQAESIALFVSLYFAVRELCFFVRGEPPSALDPSVMPQFGDCLPSNALLGGQFLLDKVDLDSTGRVVFIPGRERKGLFVASGLAMCSHLAAGVALYLRGSWPPWLLGGSACALVGRKVADLKVWEGGKAKDADDQQGSSQQWRDSMRLLCRAGELLWIYCSVRQLQQCEASDSGWLPRCE